MKILRLVFVCLLTIGSITTYSQHSSFSVMTWNIWHGGTHGNKDTGFKEDSTNTVNVLKVLQEVKPDILFMQETYCCGMEIARQAAYPYSKRASSNLSIHSKFPIIESIDIFKPFNSQAVIIDFNGQHILCVNIWLHYLPDFFNDIKTKSTDSLIAGEAPTRLKEIKSILLELDSLEKHYQLPIIIGGDFNSGSHLDWTEATKQWHYDKVVEWPVSKTMQDSGFIDSFRATNPDPTKTLQGTWGFLDGNIISDRIDYIYYKSGLFEAKKSKIIMDDPKGGFFNSDHRGILSTFELAD